MLPSDVVSHHKQIDQTSCAASGMEIVLKCHNKIPVDDHSLQKRYGGSNIGFGESHELSRRGIIPVNQTDAIGSALATLHSEVGAGRFPLVSLPVGLTASTLTVPAQVMFHIYVAEPSPKGLALLDPATGNKIEDTLVNFEQRIRGVLMKARLLGCPLPEQINFLTYSEEAP